MARKDQEVPLSFPKRFFWGAATAAHQVEGGTHNQWSVWERQHADELASQATAHAGSFPKWNEVKGEALNPKNYVSGQATDHYHRYPEDFALLKSLNLNAFRFSIEWSRIEPEEGVWNAEAIQHYRDYLRLLKAKRIEPFVTLWHWTMPIWFSEKGGFERRRNVRYFERFARKVLEELGREFRYIITINEPAVYAGQSYARGVWPPQRTNWLQTAWVALNLAHAHNRVSALAHRMSRRFIVGMAENSAHYYAGDDAWLSRLSARTATWAQDLFLRCVRRRLDFIGLNYYFSIRFYGYRIHNPNQHLSDLGWDMQPQDIQFVLERLHRKFKLPIIVTENGCADRDDEFRKWWISQTLIAMQKALQSNVRLEGYLHWSLLDNFEWSYGFWPRFGLCAVEYETLKRTPRSSALWLAKVVEHSVKKTLDDRTESELP